MINKQNPFKRMCKMYDLNKYTFYIYHPWFAISDAGTFYYGVINVSTKKKIFLYHHYNFLNTCTLSNVWVYKIGPNIRHTVQQNTCYKSPAVTLTKKLDQMFESRLVYHRLNLNVNVLIFCYVQYISKCTSWPEIIYHLQIPQPVINPSIEYLLNFVSFN